MNAKLYQVTILEWIDIRFKNSCQTKFTELRIFLDLQDSFLDNYRQRQYSVNRFFV